jgi:hypothetical protein
LEHDGVTIVAARYDEIKQGVARPAQVIIISHTHGQDSVVCRARACEVRGIVFEHFSCSPRSGDAHSKSDTPPHLNGCIKIESGDVHIVHCSITSQSGYGIKVSLPRPFHQMPIRSAFALICGTLRKTSCVSDFVGLLSAGDGQQQPAYRGMCSVSVPRGSCIADGQLMRDTERLPFEP